MKKIASRSLAPLLAAAALPFTPALAQEISTPSVSVPPAPQAAAPAPQAAAPAMVFAPQKAVVQDAPPPGPQAEDLARQAQADAAARQSARRAPVRAAAPVRNTSVSRTVTTTAPVTVAPASAPVTAAPVEAMPTASATPQVAAPAPEASAPATVQQTTTESSTGFNWLWAGIAAIAIAAIGALLFFRRRGDEAVYDGDTVYADEPVYAEPAYVEPVAVSAPVHEPEVVAAVADRPQIELGLRPIRAGSDNGQARVDYEVIVENSGALDARDVTVTSWLLNAESSEAESTLVESHVDVAVGDVATVAASAMVDAPRGAFRPVVATDARYTLPDGTQGHIAARFAVGVDGGEPGRITPIVLDRDELREDLGARLEGEVERV